MKKALLILALVVVLIAAAVTYFVTRTSPGESAAFVSADAVAYAAIPDVRQTAMRWPKTALAQIGADKQVADFLEKPLSALGTNGGTESGELLARLKPGRFFVAVPAVTHESASVVFGFQFFGGRKDLDEAMDRMHARLAKSFPNATKTSTDFQGDSITAFGAEGKTLASASHGNWAFLSNDEAALKGTLDRASGRVKDNALLTSQNFRDALAKLPAKPDLVWVIQPQTLFDLLLDLGQSGDEKISQYQAEQLRKIKSISGTLLLDGANQRETVFIGFEEPPDLGTLDHAGIRLTSADTVVFFEALQDWSTVATDGYVDSLPPAVRDFLTAAKIDLKLLPEIMGREAAVVIDWPPNATIPSVLAAIDIKDRAKAETIIKGVLASAVAQTTVSEANGVEIIRFPQLGIQLIDPAIAISDKTLFASLSLPAIEKALGARGADAATLDKSEAFKPALGAWNGGAQAFAYIDARGIFERIYNQFRPVIIFGASLMPDIASAVDVSKLPETETISKYLDPIVYTQQRVPDGWLLESSGPITLYEAFTLAGAGAGTAIALQAFGAGQ